MNTNEVHATIQPIPSTELGELGLRGDWWEITLYIGERRVGSETARSEVEATRVARATVAGMKINLANHPYLLA